VKVKNLINANNNIDFSKKNITFKKSSPSEGFSNKEKISGTIKEKSLAIIGGYSVFYSLTKLLKLFINKPFAKYFFKPSQYFTDQEKNYALVQKMLLENNILPKTNANPKGLRIIYLTEKIFNKIISQKTEPKPTIKKIIIDIIGKITLSPTKTVRERLTKIKEGKNANFLSKANLIFMPEKKLGHAVFHEIGHAVNYKFFGKKVFLLNQLGSLILYPLTLGISLFNNERKNGKKDKKKSALNFTKKHALEIVLLSQLPLLFEEGLASKRAIHFLKNKTSPQELKFAKKSLGLAFLHYLINAVIIAGNVKIAGVTSNIISNKVKQHQSVTTQLG